MESTYFDFCFSDLEIEPKEDYVAIASTGKYVENGKTQMGRISKFIVIWWLLKLPLPNSWQFWVILIEVFMWDVFDLTVTPWCSRNSLFTWQNLVLEILELDMPLIFLLCRFLQKFLYKFSIGRQLRLLFQEGLDLMLRNFLSQVNGGRHRGKYQLKKPRRKKIWDISESKYSVSKATEDAIV